MLRSIYHFYDNPDFIQKEVNQRETTSPDMKELREREEHLVFVYGTLKERYHNNHLLRESKYLGKGHTHNKRYRMFKARGFPVVEKMQNDMWHQVHGEIYAVTPDTMMELDHLEANGNLYLRNRELIMFADQKIEGKCIARLCWMYLGINETWNDYKNLTEVRPEAFINPQGLQWTTYT